MSYSQEKYRNKKVQEFKWRQLYSNNNKKCEKKNSNVRLKTVLTADNIIVYFKNQKNLLSNY